MYLVYMYSSIYIPRLNSPRREEERTVRAAGRGTVRARGGGGSYGLRGAEEHPAEGSEDAVGNGSGQAVCARRYVSVYLRGLLCDPGCPV